MSIGTSLSKIILKYYLYCICQRVLPTTSDVHNPRQATKQQRVSGRNAVPLTAHCRD